MKKILPRLDHKKYYKWLFFLPLIAILLWSPLSVSGQINLKIGYALDYLPMQRVNHIFNDYNESNVWLNQDFKPIHFHNGLQLGLRFKKEFVAFDVNVERVVARRKAEGISPFDGTTNTDLKFGFNKISSGIEILSSRIGIGINFYYEQFRIQSPIPGLDSNDTILKDSDFGNRFYLILGVPGTKMMSFSIQPYFQLPWTETNVFKLNEYLGSPSDLSSYNQRNLHFGINLVFYNGRQ